MRYLLISRILTVLITICFALNSSAQSAPSNGDKLYEEGQKYQLAMTITSQNKAIQKFKAAKAAYKSNKSGITRCNNAIAQCNKNIEILKKKPIPIPDPEPEVLSLSQGIVEFAGDQSGNVTISVKASSPDWTYSLPEGIEGETQFVKVEKDDEGNSIVISVDANTSTEIRKQTVDVTCNSITKKVKVKQYGKPVRISTDESLIKFKAKGGKKTIELYTNSDKELPDNNNLTWNVKAKPKWLTISGKRKNSSGLIGIAKDIVNGKNKLEDDDKVYVVTIIAESLKKSENSRNGEIVFGSQGKEYKVTVVQQ